MCTRYEIFYIDVPCFVYSTDYNSGLLENILQTLQSVQSTTLKLDKRMGHLESELKNLQSQSINSEREFSLQNIDDKLKVLKDEIQDGVDQKMEVFVEDIGISLDQNLTDMNDKTSQSIDQLSDVVVKCSSFTKDTNDKVEDLRQSIEQMKSTDRDLTETVSRLTKCTMYTNLRLMENLTFVATSLEESGHENEAPETLELTDSPDNIDSELSQQQDTLQDNVSVNDVTLHDGKTIKRKGANSVEGKDVSHVNPHRASTVKDSQTNKQCDGKKHT